MNSHRAKNGTLVEIDATLHGQEDVSQLMLSQKNGEMDMSNVIEIAKAATIAYNDKNWGRVTDLFGAGLKARIRGR